MRTTLTIEDHLADALKDLAHNSGRSFKAVVNEAIHRGLTDGEKPTPAQQPFHVEASARGFLPGIDPIKLNQLLDELEVDDFLESAHRGPT